MPFLRKADYPGPFDARGIPLLDYQGSLGRQYNPIAIAQFGLGNFNAFRRSGQAERWEKFLAVVPPGEDRARVEKLIGEARAPRPPPVSDYSASRTTSRT